MSSAAKLQARAEGYGALEDVEIGAMFVKRSEAASAGVHRPPMSGIYGHRELGCESICVSGGYEGDTNSSNWGDGSTIIFSGQGGGRDAKGNFTKDQEPTQNNESLLVSRRLGKPVRVLRKTNDGAYCYEGLYKVVDDWTVRPPPHGFMIYKFKLQRII